LEDFDAEAKKSLRSDFKKVCAAEVRKILRNYENQWLSISTIVEVLRERNIDVSLDLLEECVHDLLDRDDMIWERKVDGEMVIGWLGDRS